MERRRHNRKYLTYFSQVTDIESGLMIGYLVDMTPEGALLVGDINLTLGFIYDLRIDLPQGLSNQRFIQVQAKSVWSKPDIDTEFYRVGLQLIDISPADKVLLERLLSSYGKANA